MKLSILLTLFVGIIIFSPSSFAEGEINKILKPTEKSETATKKKRRKKVEMCQECGKPETECDCEGHGNNEGHSDDHKEEHKDDHKDH